MTADGLAMQGTRSSEGIYDQFAQIFQALL